jgi:hypothetical protein
MAPIFLLLMTAVLFTENCLMSDASSVPNKAGPSRVAPELTALYDEYASYQATGKPGPFKSTNLSLQVIDDRVVIDAAAAGDTRVLKSDLESLGMQHAVAFDRIVSGQLPITAIAALRALPSLNFARPATAALQRR